LPGVDRPHNPERAGYTVYETDYETDDEDNDATAAASGGTGGTGDAKGAGGTGDYLSSKQVKAALGDNKSNTTSLTGKSRARLRGKTTVNGGVGYTDRPGYVPPAPAPAAVAPAAVVPAAASKQAHVALNKAVVGNTLDWGSHLPEESTSRYASLGP
jgi:hypothetical protein